MSALRDRVYDHVSNDDGVVGRTGRGVRRLVRGTREDTSRDRLMDLLPAESVGAEVAEATQRLLDGLVTKAPPKDREVEAAKRRARSEARFAA